MADWDIALSFFKAGCLPFREIRLSLAGSSELAAESWQQRMAALKAEFRGAARTDVQSRGAGLESMSKGGVGLPGKRGDRVGSGTIK